MTSESDDRAPAARAPATPAANPYARTRVDGGCTVVAAAGEIDLATAGFLQEHLDAATATGRPDVLVDLRGVEFFDCSGLRVLCRAESRARQRGGRLRVVTDGPRLHRLLRASGLVRRFPPLLEIPESPGLPALPDLPASSESPGSPGSPGSPESPWFPEPPDQR
ncbi:STAS domain-containing protein [Streptomyces pseudovenezuelae]|uniref:STAS domain-containing protein n=1 Tax=Streptomyces pseudovenezuelae TaxID=67350 RepID=UPI002E81CF3E|nr:STAS domain-containing protein [Streptomyces pseudovenezuelae]WUA86591.1 STAS domain-containing protein [Streptomyces pseudovenezuelae]